MRRAARLPQAGRRGRGGTRPGGFSAGHPAPEADPARRRWEEAGAAGALSSPRGVAAGRKVFGSSAVRRVRSFPRGSGAYLGETGGPWALRSPAERFGKTQSKRRSPEGSRGFPTARLPAGERFICCLPIRRRDGGRAGCRPMRRPPGGGVPAPARRCRFRQWRPPPGRGSSSPAAGPGCCGRTRPARPASSGCPGGRRW